MKQRNGFVSNSSSASFICYWYGDENNDLKSTLTKMFDSWGDGETQSMINKLISKTSKDGAPGVYLTQMWTSMYNDIRDIPESMAYLLTALQVSNDEKLISFKMDH